MAGKNIVGFALFSLLNVHCAGEFSSPMTDVDGAVAFDGSTALDAATFDDFGVTEDAEVGFDFGVAEDASLRIDLGMFDGGVTADASVDAATADASIATCTLADLPPEEDPFVSWSRVYVAPSGVDDTSSGRGASAGRPFATIGFAVRNAVPPAVVELSAGVHFVAAKVDVPVGIVLRGAPRNVAGELTTIIRPGSGDTSCAAGTWPPTDDNAILELDNAPGATLASGVERVAFEHCVVPGRSTNRARDCAFNSGLRDGCPPLLSIQARNRDFMRFVDLRFRNTISAALSVSADYAGDDAVGGWVTRVHDRTGDFDYARHLRADSLLFEDCGEGTLVASAALSFIADAELSRIRFVRSSAASDGANMAGRGWLRVNAHDIVSSSDYWTIETWWLHDSEIYGIRSRVGFSLIGNDRTALHHNVIYGPSGYATRQGFEFGGNDSEIAFNHVERAGSGVDFILGFAGQNHNTIAHNALVRSARGMGGFADCAQHVADDPEKSCAGRFDDNVFSQNTMLHASEREGVTALGLDAHRVDPMGPVISNIRFDNNVLSGVAESDATMDGFRAGSGSYFLDARDHAAPSMGFDPLLSTIRNVRLAGNLIHRVKNGSSSSRMRLSPATLDVVASSQVDLGTSASMAPAMDCPASGLTLSCTRLATQPSGAAPISTTRVWTDPDVAPRGAIHAYENERWPALYAASAAGQAFTSSLRGTSWSAPVPRQARLHVLARKGMTGARWRVEVTVSRTSDGTICSLATHDGSRIALGTASQTGTSAVLETTPLDVEYGWHTLVVDLPAGVTSIDHVSFGDAL